MMMSNRDTSIKVITRQRTSGGTTYGLSYTDTNGKRVRRFNRDWNRSDAQAEANRLETLARHGIDPSCEGEYTLSHLYRDWRDLHVDVSCTAKTADFYSTSWRKRIEPTIGHLPVHKIGKDAVRHMIREGKDHGDSASSLNAATATLSSMLGFAVDAGRIEHNPVHGIKRQPRNKRTAIAWSVEDIDAVAKHISDERMRILVLLAYYTGMRSGELRARMWGDFGEEWIRVHSAVCPTTNQVKPTKTGTERMVPIIPQARRLIDQLAVMPGVSVNASSLIFPTRSGSVIAHSNLLSHHFHPARKEAGKVDPRLGGMRFHELRHSWVSLMLGTGVAPATVASWSGHTIDVMLRSYAHAIPMNVSVNELGKAFV